jgi:hypothetical protein
MNLEENAPASWGVDLTCEAEILERYDVDALALKIEDTIASRAFTRAAMTGAAIALALAGVAAVSLSAYASEPAPPPPAVVEQVQCPPCPYASEDEEEAEEPKLEPTVAPPRDKPLRRVKVEETPVVVENVEAQPVDEKSRLRAQLDLYDRATHALTNGDHHDAIALADQLRTEYDDGPLAIEAGIVEVKGLLRVGANDTARALIKTLRADPRCEPRVDELRALALELPWPRVIDEPREEPIEIDGPDLDAHELVRRKLSGKGSFDPAETLP